MTQEKERNDGWEASIYEGSFCVQQGAVMSRKCQIYLHDGRRGVETQKDTHQDKNTVCGSGLRRGPGGAVNTVDMLDPLLVLYRIQTMAQPAKSTSPIHRISLKETSVSLKEYSPLVERTLEQYAMSNLFVTFILFNLLVIQQS